MTEKDFVFIDDKQENEQGQNIKPWKIALIDDDEDVHTVTKMALRKFEFEGRGLEFIHAYSAAEGYDLINNNPDTALIFLDVVMESYDSGLILARQIREELNNHFVRIVLRTGQPGQNPERDVIRNFDINDYKEKQELTVNRLYTTVISSLRTYDSLMRIERSRQGLRKLIYSTGELFSAKSVDQFISSLLEQILSLTGNEENACVGYNGVFVGEKASNSPFASKQNPKPNPELRIIGGIGRFADKIGEKVEDITDKNTMQIIQQVQASQESFYSENFSVIHMCKPFSSGIIFIEGNNRIPDQFEQDLLELLACEASSAREKVLLNQELDQTLKEVVLMLGSLTEFRSKETQNHILRVSKFAELLGEKAGLSATDVQLLQLAATMHDVGKVGIPDNILNKPDKLTPEEFEIIKSHTTIGQQSLAFSNRPLFEAGSIIAHQHQEKWDGSGYPQGLKGEEIHLFARITAIADVFDALSFKRCYRPGWEYDKVKEHMLKGAGTHFDPNLVKLFFSDETALQKILKEYKD